MKKKIVALSCAIVLSLSMSMTAFAAGSVTTGSAASNAGDPGLATKTQQFNQSTIDEFSKTTTVESNVKATVSVVSEETAKAAIAEAKATVGENAFIATVVDLVVPEGTGEATFTLKCANVWAGQNVVILHQKADKTWETIKPSKVENGSVTFAITSYSPVAVVINATAPKTGEIVAIICIITIVGLAGVLFFDKKSRTA